MKRHFWLLVGVVLMVSGCTINRDIMFKTPTEFTFDPLPEVDSLEYRISPYDRIEFNLFTNDGYKLVDILGSQVGGRNNAQSIRQFGINYLVEQDGRVKLPTLGRVDLGGKTIQEAEEFLESEYSEFYRKPFVQIAVINNQVIVSPGSGGSARVVNIRDNMTVIEVLAMAGGITDRGNASKVKVIRTVDGRKEVYKLNLGKIGGIYEGDMIVQANDIIYVEPNAELVREVLRDLTPVISLITSTLFLFSIVNP